MAAKSEELAAIQPDQLYPLELFERQVGLGKSALRQARDRGLAVKYVHGRAFILGRDWIAYVQEHGKGVKDG